MGKGDACSILNDGLEATYHQKPFIANIFCQSGNEIMLHRTQIRPKFV